MKIFDKIRKNNQEPPQEPRKPEELEREKITLSLRAADVERRQKQEEIKRAGEAMEIQKAAKERMQEIEKAREKSAEALEKKLSSRSAEIDEIKNTTAINEAQTFLEADRKKRTLKAEADEAQKAADALRERLIREKGKAAGRINSEDEEILALKTRIALRDAQRRANEEKHAMFLRELRDKLDDQLIAAERKITGQEAAFKARLGQIENELISVKAASDKKISDITLDFDEYNAKMTAIKDRLAREADSLKDEIVRETTAFHAELKKCDEEINGLKIQIMLGETQEKSEREKMNATFREEEEKAAKKITEIERKTVEQSSSFEQLIRAKEEEFNAVKVNSELNQRDHPKSLNARKKELSDFLDALNAEKQTLSEKLVLDKEENAKTFEVKKAEVAALKGGWEKKHKEIREKYEAESKRMEVELKALGEKVAAKEREASGQKSLYEKAITEKEAEIERLQKECAERDENGAKELVEMEKSYNESSAGVKAEVEKLSGKILQAQEAVRKADVENAEGIRTLSEKYESEMRRLAERHESDLRDLGIEKASLMIAMDDVEVTRRETNETFKAQETQKRSRIEALMARLDEQQNEFEARKLTLRQEFNERRKELESQKENLLKQASALEEERANFEKAAEKQKEQLEERFAARKQEAELAFRKESEKYEEERTGLAGEIESRKRKLSEEVRSFEDRLAVLESEHKQSFAAAEAKEKDLADQLSAIGEDILAQREPMEKEIVALKEQIALKKKEFSDRVADVESAITLLKDRITGFEKESAKIAEKREKEYFAEREKFKEEINSIKSAIESTNQSNLRTLEDKSSEIEKAKSDYSARLSMMLKEQARMHKEWAALKVELDKEADDLRTQYEELSQNLPEQLQEKHRFKDELENRILNREEELAREKSLFEKRLRKFSRRLQRKKTSAGQYFEGLAKDYDDKINRKEAELAVVKAEYAGKEEELLKVIDADASAFAQKRYGYEQEKEKITADKLKLESETLEKIRQTDKEIIGLQQRMNLTEETFAVAKAAIRADMGKAADLFRRDTESLVQRIKSEDDLARTQMKEKETLATRVRVEAEAKIKALAEKFEAQKNAHDEELAIMGSEMKRLAAGFEKERAEKNAALAGKTLEAENAERAAREKEKEAAAGIGRLRAGYEIERKKLEEEVSRLQRELAAQTLEFGSRLNEMDGARAAMESDYSRRGASLNEKNLAYEQVLLSRKSVLEKETASWNQKIEDLRKTFEHERGILEGRLEKAKTSLEVRLAQQAAERSRAEHGLKKTLNVIEEKISGLRHKFISEKREWDETLHLKDEESRALMFRFSGREVRIKEESEKRARELEAIIAEFEKQVNERREEFVKTGPGGEEQIKKYKEEIEKLKETIAQRQEQWNEKKQKYVSDAENRMKEVESEIGVLEKHFKEKESYIRELVEKKEKQLEVLKEAILFKDTELSSESRHTGRETVMARENLAAVRREVRYPDIINPDVQEAVSVFNRKDLRGAIKAFTEILMSQPNSHIACEYLAVCYFELGLLDESAKFARKTLELDKDNPRVKNILLRIRRS
jgi:hypothetical protein